MIVNTKAVRERERPKSIYDLLDAKWKGKIGIAKPLFGTTATHAACLFAALGEEKAKEFCRQLKANDVQILSGNAQVAQAVAGGQFAFGLTDTDDAIGMVEKGEPRGDRLSRPAVGRTGHAVHSQHAGDHQGVSASAGGPAAGRLSVVADRGSARWPRAPVPRFR